MISIIEMQSGEFLGITVMEITSIPSSKILVKPSKKTIEDVFKNDFARFLSEVHHLAFHAVYGEMNIGDVALDITWATSPVTNQLHSARISIFIVCRVIGKTESYVSDKITSLNKILKTLLHNQRYDCESISYKKYLDQVCIDTESCCALIRHERMELTTVPTVPCVYHYGCVPESDLDLSSIVGTLAFCPSSVVHVQVIPTVFNLDELEYISTFVHNASYASRGIMTREGQISFSQIDNSLKTYKYYENQNDGSLFLYNIIIRSPNDSIGAICSQLYGQLNSDPSIPVKFDTITLRKDFFSEMNMLFQPWLVQDYCMDHIRSTLLSADQWVIPNNIRRLPLVMTATELSELFRLPIGTESVRSGLIINESKRSYAVYRDNIINSGDIQIGHLKLSHNNMIGITLGDLTKHMFVAGTPGSGKSSFSVGVLDRLWNEHKIPFLVIEPAKTEYRAMMKSIPDLQVFTPGKEHISPFTFNPFNPPKNVKLKSYKSTLKTAFSAAVSMSSPLDKIFEETINNCYSEHHWLDTYTSDDGGEVFNIVEFIQCFKETFNAIGYVGDSTNIGRAGIVRLNSLVNLFDNYNSIPIEDLLTKPTVIELAAIENAEQKSLMIALILLSILSYINVNYKGDGVLKNIILLEEAHVLLDQESNDSSDSNPVPLAKSLVKRFLAEARSYGVGLIIADQSPRKVGLDIVALTDIKIIFRIVEGTDKEIIGDSTSMDDVQLSRLSKLRPGNAYIYFSKLDNPEEIKIDDYRANSMIPTWMSDSDVIKLSKYWDDNKSFLRPYPECELLPCCKESCDYNRRIIAKDVASRIIKKNIGQSKDIERLKSVSSNLVSLIKKELNGDLFDKKLYYCVKVHFWRYIMYNSNYKLLHG